jgi:hypothetical protein
VRCACNDWTERLAALAAALAAIPGRSAILDAELVFPAADGAPDFRGLQAAMGVGRQHELAVFAFDLLYRDGVDLCPLPLGQRKDQLATLLHRANVDCLHLVATFPDGVKLLASAERMKLEGIVFETPELALQVGRVPRLAQDQDAPGARLTGNGGDCSNAATAACEGGGPGASERRGRIAPGPLELSVGGQVFPGPGEPDSASLMKGEPRRRC